MMTNNRLDVLKGMVAQNPDDTRTRYMLAMELSNTNDFAGAVSEYQAILANEPDYIPVYFHCGQTLEKLDRVDDARDIYRRGIELCERQGDQKTRDELQGVLEDLG